MTTKKVTTEIPLKWTDKISLKNNYTSTVIEYKLSYILYELRKIQVTHDGRGDYNTINLKNTRALHFPKTISLVSLFDDKLFASRFATCWPSYHLSKLVSTTLESGRIPGVLIQITDDLNSTSSSSSSSAAVALNPIEQHAFRSIFCFFTKYYFDLNWPMCACYPQNPYEYCLYEVGIGKNCYNSECRSFLSTNQHTYDSFVHTSCDDTVQQIAIVTLNKFFINPNSINLSINQNIQS